MPPWRRPRVRPSESVSGPQVATPTAPPGAAAPSTVDPGVGRAGASLLATLRVGAVVPRTSDVAVPRTRSGSPSQAAAVALQPTWARVLVEEDTEDLSWTRKRPRRRRRHQEAPM